MEYFQVVASLIDDAMKNSAIDGTPFGVSKQLSELYRTYIIRQEKLALCLRVKVVV